MLSFWEILALIGTASTILGVFLALYAMINNKTLKKESRLTREVLTETIAEESKLTREAMAEESKLTRETIAEESKLTREVIGKMIQETTKYLGDLIFSISGKRKKEDVVREG